MRVGVIGLMHESNTFLPTPTTLENFQRWHLLEGQAVRKQYAEAHHEIGGFFEGLQASGIEPVPIFAAWAAPSGTIAAEAFDGLLERLTAALDAAGPLDGLLAAPHGAAVAANEHDMDGRWLGLLRERLGRQTPIIATLDPHANLSPRMAQAADALIAYRTNPHLDQRERGLEAARLMSRTLRGEIRPTMRAAFPPLAINIERQRTADSPCREMYALADEIAARPGVLTDSVTLGFPYADVAEMGTACVVVTDNNPQLAESCVNELAAYLWTHRDDFRGQFVSIAEAVELARRGPAPVGLLDMGDNVGGGSPGDGTLLLDALTKAGVAPTLACLFDPAAAEQARAAGAGRRVTLSIGGHTDTQHGEPFTADVTVESLHSGQFTETETRHGGQTTYDMGPTVVVRTAAGQTIVLSSRRMPPFSLGQVTCTGLDPRKFQAIVIKGVHAPVAAYAPVCASLVRVDTPGITRADMTQLAFHHRRKPLFPFETDFDWKP